MHVLLNVSPDDECLFDPFKGSCCYLIQFVNSVYITSQSDDILNNLSRLLYSHVEEDFHCIQSSERVFVRDEQVGYRLLIVINESWYFNS